MANISNQIGQGDVTRWGIIAMLFGGVALLSFSLSGKVPENVAVGLHATRMDGGNVNMLRQQVADLQLQQRATERDTQMLDGQLRLTERDQSNMVRRLSALETAIPALLEVTPPDAELDFSLMTGAIGDPTEESFETDGGSVTLTQRPLFAEPEEPDAEDFLESIPALPPSLGEQLPEELRRVEPDTNTLLTATEFGLAIGEIVTDDSAEAQWTELRQRVGTLLIGLEPALSDPAGTGDSRIIVGPISDYAAAEGLCLRIARAGVPCLPVQYADEDLLQLSALGYSN